MFALSTQAALLNLAESLEESIKVPLLSANETPITAAAALHLTDIDETTAGSSSNSNNIKQHQVVPYPRNKSQSSRAASEAAESSSCEDFRMGGLGRSRGKAKFNVNRIRGLYEDDPSDMIDCENAGDESQGINGNDVTSSVRRRGTVVFMPRGDSESGWLCYVRDSIDSTLRACSFRTFVVSFS